MSKVAILVLEDDDALRELIEEGLEDQGYAVTPVGSSLEALKVADTVVFDIIVADVRMAGMDGLACLAELRKMQPQARRLVITGYASHEAPSRAIQVEADDYLYKPFKMQALVAAIQRILGREEEQERYQGLFASVVTGYRRLVQKAGAALASAELSSLEPLREQALQGLYVAVRSKMLTRHDAQALWERLEELEAGRDQLKTPGLHTKERQALGEGYRYVLDLLKATSSGTSTVLHSRGRMEAREINHLVEGIQAGTISTEQLKVAAFLRQLPADQRQGSHELAGLYRSIWGGTAAAER